MKKIKEFVISTTALKIIIKVFIKQNKNDSRWKLESS